MNLFGGGYLSPERYIILLEISLIGRSVCKCTDFVHGLRVYRKTTHVFCGWSANWLNWDSNFLVQYMGVIKIDLAETYEYPSPVKLEGDEGTYYATPASIILATNIDVKRIPVFSHFSIRRGLDRTVLFSINGIVKWMGRKSNRNANGINNKILQVIKFLCTNRYLQLSDEIDNGQYSEAVLNLSKISEECEKQRFAVIYLDELKKVMAYKNPNPKDVYFSSDVVLLVFAYLRMKIYRRSNKLSLGEKNVTTRKLDSPDAYDCYYVEIADDLGISARSVAKAVQVLKDMGLIYYESLPRSQLNGNWRTDHTIFCNAYKREGSYLLASGRDYYESEIKNKKKKLKYIRGKYEGGSSHD